MSISNKEFWKHWKNGNYNEALASSVTGEKRQENRLQSMLFGSQEQMIQTGMITTVSAGEFIYDFMMINPQAVQGLDFARTEDLSSLFTLSKFSEQIDPTVLTGDFAQLQGYVAEQMVAAELQSKGHDVEFPDDSNNPGWDILVDGHPFQVKDLASPEGVREHLETYPDIPVYVNEELASSFEGNPDVYVSNISRDDVIEATSSTINHADDLLDFEIPWITAGVSTIYNIKRVWKDDVAINQAVFNVVSDTSSRTVTGFLGQKTGVLLGTLLFGPAGGLTGAMAGAFLGASQGGRLSSGIKRTFSKKQERAVGTASVALINKVINQIDEKVKIKERKLNDIKNGLKGSDADKAVYQEAERRANEEIRYINNKREELAAISRSLKTGTVDVRRVLPHIMATITRSGVHPVHFQEELQQVQASSVAYMKKV